VKNQYFGDITDYRNYGLLRMLAQETGMRSLVVWMLTPDDGRRDGRRIRYLDDPARWRRFDPALFDALQTLVTGHGRRSVALIEISGLLTGAEFYSDTVPDKLSARELWFDRLVARSGDFDLLFFDPDNGIEVKSTPKGRRHSSKYVYWDELAKSYSLGASLLVCQHFPRIPRDRFIETLASRLAQVVEVDTVLTFRTAHAVFLLAPQHRHKVFLSFAAESVAHRWRDQILVSKVSVR
jgi:hypothetical protein